MNKLHACWFTARPIQWAKNIFCFIPWVLTHPSQQPWNSFFDSLIVFGVFCLASSSVYFLNDAFDIEADRSHPVKKFRPMANGDLSVTQGLVCVIALIIGAFLGAYFLLDNPSGVIWTLGGFLFLNLVYNAVTKHVAYFDAATIGFGFLMRIWAGYEVVEQTPDYLVLVGVFLAAATVIFGKRRAELADLLAPREVEVILFPSRRRSLHFYSIPFLDGKILLLLLALNGVWITWILKQPNCLFLWISVLPALAASFRYRQLVQQSSEAERPETLFLHDRWLSIFALLWAALVLICLETTRI